MRRDLYKKWFTMHRPPNWMCPSCNVGMLQIMEDTLVRKELARSRAQHGRKGWDPFSIEYVYSCIFRCSNADCGEFVASCGTGCVEPDFVENDDGVPDPDFVEWYHPKHIHPHLRVFPVPENTPANVVEEINKSFELLFSSPPSAANHIRVAIEHLLTHLRVRSTGRTKKRKRRHLSLHERIELLTGRHGQLKERLLAIKWLGNAGSHSGPDTSIDDVMDAYEMMETVLEELFGKKQARVTKMAKRINKRKGRPGRKARQT